MPELLPPEPPPRRRRSFRPAFSGLTALACVGAVLACFADLPFGSALGLSDDDLVAGSGGTGRSVPLQALLEKRQWFNGQLDDKALRGKVVLVNFWTYSCINSLRPLPYLKAWAAKYGPRGLVVIGVHTPEFGFEKDTGNVRAALKMLGVTYPVALDSDYGIWRDFQNRGWPGFYLIDASGQVRHEHLGEGDYSRTELWIEELLAEKDGMAPSGGPEPVHGSGIEAAADWVNLQSLETYVGRAKADRFSSPGGLMPDRAHRYSQAAVLPLNHWDFSGTWSVGSEFAVPAGARSVLRYRFHSRDLHLVMGLPPGHAPVRFRVLIDGAAPGLDHGVDVDSMAGENCSKTAFINWSASPVRCATGCLRSSSAHLELRHTPSHSDSIGLARATQIALDLETKLSRLWRYDSRCEWNTSQASFNQPVPLMISEHFVQRQWPAVPRRLGSEEAPVWECGPDVASYNLRSGFAVKIDAMFGAHIRPDYDILNAIAITCGHDGLNALLAESADQGAMLIECAGKLRLMWLSRGAGKRDIFEYVTVREPAAARRLPTEYEPLAGKSVAIVGCGSVGSKIAASLARAGVGRFVLVDGDIF